MQSHPHANDQYQTLAFSYHFEEMFQQLATNNFGPQSFLAQGGFGLVYKGELSLPSGCQSVAIKRLYGMSMQGRHEFGTEITLLTKFRHKNLVRLLGFCDEDMEMILVYEYINRGSLDKYLRDPSFSWLQRLGVCIGVAHGLDHLHNQVGEQYRVIHRDIKSANILLSEDWEAKIADFGLSRIALANQEISLVMSNACGTFGYIDPVYHETNILTKESDVYSFGVVLFEVLSGTQAFIISKDSPKGLAQLAKHHYECNRLLEIVNPNIKDQIHSDSLNIFSKIAYRCLHKDQKARPSMDLVVKELEQALQFQVLWVERLQKYKIPLEEIKIATNNFSDENLKGLGQGGVRIYLGEISHAEGRRMVTIKRQGEIHEVGKYEFLNEISVFFNFTHKNLVSLLGFFADDMERILVYEHEHSDGCLDKYIGNRSLTWIQRINICVGVARVLTYIHMHGGVYRGHGCIKSSKILLNEHLEPKVFYHEVSGVGHDCGYRANRPYNYHDQTNWKIDNVYSFGLILVEMLLGKLLVDEGDAELKQFQRDWFLCKTYDGEYRQNWCSHVDPSIRDQTRSKSMYVFSYLAYNCTKDATPPPMDEVLRTLLEALKYQEDYERPRDYEEINRTSDSPVVDATKDGLLDHLSKGILLHGGKEWFQVREARNNYVMISATTFDYASDHTWVSMPESRFPKVAKLPCAWLLNIKVTIRGNELLSPEVTYATYLVFKYCCNIPVSNVPLRVGMRHVVQNTRPGLVCVDNRRLPIYANWRDDGWMMVELSQFIYSEGHKDFEITVMGFDYDDKREPGVLVEGIEFQPIAKEPEVYQPTRSCIHKPEPRNYTFRQSLFNNFYHLSKPKPRYFKSLCNNNVRTAFTTKGDFGKEERERQWALAQRTLHGLAPPEAQTTRSTYMDLSQMAEEAKRRAEIVRLRELFTLKGHVESVVRMKNLDIDTIQQSYSV